jgi:hypothetical protein
MADRVTILAIGLAAGARAAAVRRVAWLGQTQRLPTRPGTDGDVEMLLAERPAGAFTRQVFLGDALDAGHIDADYTAGVLTLTIPLHEAAKPRKVEITSQDASADREQCHEPGGPDRPGGGQAERGVARDGRVPQDPRRGRAVAAR